MLEERYFIFGNIGEIRLDLIEGKLYKGARFKNSFNNFLEKHKGKIYVCKFDPNRFETTSKDFNLIYRSGFYKKTSPTNLSQLINNLKDGIDVLLPKEIRVDTVNGETPFDSEGIFMREGRGNLLLDLFRYLGEKEGLVFNTLFVLEKKFTGNNQVLEVISGQQDMKPLESEDVINPLDSIGGRRRSKRSKTKKTKKSKKLKKSKRLR